MGLGTTDHQQSCWNRDPSITWLPLSLTLSIPAHRSGFRYHVHFLSDSVTHLRHLPALWNEVWGVRAPFPQLTRPWWLTRSCYLLTSHTEGSQLMPCSSRMHCLTWTVCLEWTLVGLSIPAPVIWGQWRILGWTGWKAVFLFLLISLMSLPV